MSQTSPIDIFESIHDGAFFVDVDADEILDVNEPACELVGYDREELLSLGVSDIHPDQMERMRDLAEEAEDDGTLASDLHCLRKDGRSVPIEASACSATIDNESGILVIVRDISSLERQKHFLKVLDRILRHNLRNRLNVVLNRAEFVERYADDEEICEQSELLCEAVDDVIHLVEEVRTVEKSVRNSDNEMRPMECSTILQRVTTQLKARHPTATITTDMPESLRVRADDRLALVFKHVIENAIVHNDTETPTVEVVGKQIGDDGIAEIAVLDDGPGIPQAERLTVLDPSETSALDHGTGVGLWVASTLVSVFDGDLDITDNDPRGAIVTVRLPLVEQTQAS
jgi:PAS domain S-box-containing protein